MADSLDAVDDASDVLESPAVESYALSERGVPQAGVRHQASVRAKELVSTAVRVTPAVRVLPSAHLALNLVS